jgi:NAD(P)-dependent dehydrogenase (short-subunit alcohol dehydrogenase family)
MHMTSIDFTGQVAIVTGAGRGMGRAHAMLLAARGAKVVVNDYGGAESTIEPGTREVAETVVREITDAGGIAVADANSVGTGASAEAIVNTALAAFGRVDILVNNAGGALIGRLDEFSDAQIEGVVRSNYLGAYHLMRRAWPLMRAQHYGRIVNILSSGILGIGSLASYGSSKAALIGLTTEAAIEGREHDIRVNGVLPCGHSRLTEKSQEDAARWFRTYFQPEKVAAAVAYLASREVATSGELFSVGAGRVARMAIVSARGFLDPHLTPESLCANIERARDLGDAAVVASSWEESQRFLEIAPWTGGGQGVF